MLSPTNVPLAPSGELLLRFRDDAQLTPFIVFTAGRSRTMWLSAFLSYGICHCNFEAAARFDNFAQICEALQVPGIGAAETAAAPVWRLLKLAAPKLRMVVVRRDAEEIVESFAQRVQAQAPLDELRKIVHRSQRYLDEISEHADALTVDFHSLDDAEVARAVFEHCLPYKFDPGWYEFMQTKKLDPDIVQLTQLWSARLPATQKLAHECRHLFFRLARSGYISKELH